MARQFAVSMFPEHTHAYLVGKGPSLDTLVVQDFPDKQAPVLCLNESIHRIERLRLPNPCYCIQQDAKLLTTCKPVMSTWVLSKQAWVAGKGDVTALAYQYDPLDYGHKTTSLTGMVALDMLHKAGYTKITMLGFDARFGAGLGYAASIGHDAKCKGQADDRFIRHDERIAARAVETGIELEWIPPKPVGGLWTVAMVCVGDGKAYHQGHVKALQDRFCECCDSSYNFAVLGDREWATDRVLHNWPGWFSKLELFRPGLFMGPVLYLDLDVWPNRTFRLPDPAVLTPGLLYAPIDIGRPGVHQTSVMAWIGDTVTAPYYAYRNKQHTGRDDEVVIQKALSKREFGDIRKILSTKSWKLEPATRHSADIIYFHGSPKPWDPEVGLLQIPKL